jgi:hypothetical protein
MLLGVLIALVIASFVACVGLWSLVVILYKRTGPVYQSDNKFEAHTVPFSTQNLQKPTHPSRIKHVPFSRTEKEELELEKKKNDEFR